MTQDKKTPQPSKAKRAGAGEIVLGAIAPHPPHLVYAENPPQNEPRAECGWETLRWAYDGLRDSIEKHKPEVLVVMSPHWRTYVGTHILGLPHFKGLSVDPIFPNLFRYQYDMKVDVDLARQLCENMTEKNLAAKLMTNPDFRVDYGTIVSCHMCRPQWDIPVVAMSSNAVSAYFNFDVMQSHMKALGQVTRETVLASGKRVALIASHSLSHRHFTSESPLPEDMSREHIYHHGQYLWDMKMLELMRAGKSQEILDILPDFTEQATAETDSGALTWLLHSMGIPKIKAKVHGYGTVIGTGNAVVEWPLSASASAKGGEACL